MVVYRRLEKIKKQSLVAITNAYKEIGLTANGDGVLDIAVSFDGAWGKRGYSSHNGLAIAIDLLTGLPVDYEVLSNFCLNCKIAASRPETTTAWQESHSKDCAKNYNGQIEVGQYFIINRKACQ